MNTKRIRFALYFISIMLLVIPACVVIVTDVPFSPISTKVFICTSISLIIIGNVLNVVEKGLKDKSTHINIGFIIGLFIVLINRVLE